MADDADKQKRWIRAIFMNGVAMGYSMCLKSRMGTSDRVAMDVSGQEAYDTYYHWGVTLDELKEAQAYVIELHNDDDGEVDNNV